LFPALMIALIRHAQFEDTTRYLALFGVLIFSALLLLAISNFLPALGLREWQIRLRAKLGREGVDPGAIPGNFVAFVRAGLRETPASPLDGEMGWVFLAGQRLCFLGIQTRFGLELGSIRSIQTRPVFFGWWPAEQIVLAVRDGPEPGGSPLTLWPADFRSVRQISPKAAKLAASLQSWHEGTALPGVEPPELANLPPLVSRPDLGAVSGRVRHRMNSVLGLTVTVLIAWMVCVLAHFPFDLTQGDEGWAMLLLAGAAGLFHSIPSWRARSGQLRPGKNLDLPRSTGNRATT